jgi:ribosomal protein S27AE
MASSGVSTTIWAARSCPNCGEDSLHALEGSPRIWCGRCGWKTTYTRGTPFYDSELVPDEFLIAFILYADTLLSGGGIHLFSTRFSHPQTRVGIIRPN